MGKKKPHGGTALDGDLEEVAKGAFPLSRFEAANFLASELK